MLYEFALGPKATVERTTIRTRRAETGELLGVDKLNSGPAEDCQPQIATHLLIFTDCMCFVDRRSVNVPVIKGCVVFPPDEWCYQQANSTDANGYTRVTYTKNIPPLNSTPTPKWTWEVRVCACVPVCEQCHAYIGVYR